MRKPDPPPDPSVNGNHLSEEQHFKLKEIAEKWSISPSTAQVIFRNVPGVLEFPGKHGGRRRVELRVPQSIMEQKHRELSGQSLEDPEEGN